MPIPHEANLPLPQNEKYKIRVDKRPILFYGILVITHFLRDDYPHFPLICLHAARLS